MKDLFFEDFAVGQQFRTRGATLSEAQILDFAFQYDPQPFHLDKNAAEESIYGGLIASGFQTLLFAFRLWLAEGIINKASMGSPGIDALRWLTPVRPGDTLQLQAEVVETRASASKPDVGFTTIDYTVFNQDQVAAMTFRATHILLKRRRSEND